MYEWCGSMSKAQHLRAHASRLLAFAERFRHGGHDAGAEQIATQAVHYLGAAASLDTSERPIIASFTRRQLFQARLQKSPFWPLPQPALLRVR